MKKIFGTVLAIVLASSVLAGCGKEDTTDNSLETTTEPTIETSAEENAGTSVGYPATPAATDMPIDVAEEVTPAVDLTDYPVMWCNPSNLYPDQYDAYNSTTLASETYERNDVIATVFNGYRLIDDTHAERFLHFKFNDDIDTSIMVTSQDESLNSNNTVRINDREEDGILETCTYEINGTEIIITDEKTSITVTYQLSPDFTSIVNTVDPSQKYTYYPDF